MLSFYLQEFADSGPCSAHKPYNEIPFHQSVRFQFPLQKPVISIADDVFQEILLLNLDELQLELVFTNKLKILVDTLQTQVDCLRPEMFHKKTLVRQEVLLINLAVV